MPSRPAVLTLVPLLALGGAYAVATTWASRQADTGGPRLYERARDLQAVADDVPGRATASPLDLVPPDRRDLRGKQTLALLVEQLHERTFQMVGVEVAGDGRHGTTRYAGPSVRTRRGRPVESRSEVPWVRGADGQWYVDVDQFVIR
jgi:hypothetical protein